jgi:hypothetical protein
VKKGRLLSLVLAALTVLFVVIGTAAPAPSAAFYAASANLLRSSATPQAAAENLADAIRARDFAKAYNSLANKGALTQAQLEHDLTGTYPNLLTYSTIASSDVRPLHATDDDATMRLSLHWATVVGPATVTRDLHVVKVGSNWKVEWPAVKEATVPAQVIAVNYLRWDVIYRGSGDDWGAQDVEAPHVSIVDMIPVERAEGVVILGELINNDVVPAYVTVNATLLSKDKKPLATEGSFDKISHLLLPKQVTPFFIRFPKMSLSQVGTILMNPTASLVAASADPVIELANEEIHPAPDAALTGQLINQSGQVVNVAHVLGTFYDKNGKVVWVADQYVDHALLPQTPVPFTIHIPEDLSKNIATQRTVIATYSTGVGE